MATPTYQFYTPSPLLVGLEAATNATNMVAEELRTAEEAKRQFSMAADVLESQGFDGDALAHRALAENIRPNFSKAIREKKASDFGVSKLTDNLLKVFSDERRNDAMAERQRNQINAVDRRQELQLTDRQEARRQQALTRQASQMITRYNQLNSQAARARANGNYDEARRLQQEADDLKASINALNAAALTPAKGGARNGTSGLNRAPTYFENDGPAAPLPGEDDGVPTGTIDVDILPPFPEDGSIPRVERVDQPTDPNDPNYSNPQDQRLNEERSGQPQDMSGVGLREYSQRQLRNTPVGERNIPMVQGLLARAKSKQEVDSVLRLSGNRDALLDIERAWDKRDSADRAERRMQGSNRVDSYKTISEARTIAQALIHDLAPNERPRIKGGPGAFRVEVETLKDGYILTVNGREYVIVGNIVERKYGENDWRRDPSYTPAKLLLDAATVDAVPEKRPIDFQSTDIAPQSPAGTGQTLDQQSGTPSAQGSFRNPESSIKNLKQGWQQNKSQ